MASGDPGAADPGARPRCLYLRVLLPFSCDSLRIPGELADVIGAAEALVVGPSGGKVKVWPVEVGRDGDGAFLGRGWPEFAAACGAGAGWILVLRHRGRGLLTVKAFDASGCLAEVGTPPAVEATMISKDASRKPQFISVLPQDSMEKMLIPAMFVQHYMPKEHLKNLMAIVLGPLGKVWRIELEMNRSDVFFAGRWAEFLAFHGITEANALLLRYEGNMVFTVKVFQLDGCQRESKHKDIRMQQSEENINIEKLQKAPSTSIQKRKSKNDWPSSEGQKKPKGSMTSLNKASLCKKTVYVIGPPSWIRKHVNANTRENQLALPISFCDAIGLQGTCTISLKTSMNSTGSWLVHGHPYKNNSYLFVRGWRRFCQENSLKEGDICTFNVVKATLWHVVITRCKEKINQLCNLETPIASSRKYKSKNDWRSGDGQKRLEGSMTSLNKSSLQRGCVFDIGPPSWIRKEINANTLEHSLSLAPSFCDAIGFQKPCTITLKSSIDSTKSWQVHGIPYNNSSHKLLAGWKRFCKENGLKEGDVCTFNVVETMLWHVDISHQH